MLTSMKMSENEYISLCDQYSESYDVFDQIMTNFGLIILEWKTVQICDPGCLIQ